MNFSVLGRVFEKVILRVSGGLGGGRLEELRIDGRLIVRAEEVSRDRAKWRTSRRCWRM